MARVDSCPGKFVNKSIFFCEQIVNNSSTSLHYIRLAMSRAHTIPGRGPPLSIHIRATKLGAASCDSRGSWELQPAAGRSCPDIGELRELPGSVPDVHKRATSCAWKILPIRRELQSIANPFTKSLHFVHKKYLDFFQKI